LIDGSKFVRLIQFKQFNYFSTIYFKKNLVEKQALSLVPYIVKCNKQEVLAVEVREDGGPWTDYIAEKASVYSVAKLLSLEFIIHCNTKDIAKISYYHHQ
jgi:hypothetical protein